MLGIVHLTQAAKRQVVEYYAPSVGMTLKCTVLTPDGYEKTVKKYPVLYLLHGHTGNYTSWITYAGLPLQTADQHQLIIVLPDGGNSFYLNWHGQTDGKPHRWEDMIVRDLIPFVDKTFRTHAAKDGRIIGGLSMGGFGAVVLGLKHPDLFGAVFSSAGCLKMGINIKNEIKRDTVDWNSPMLWSKDNERVVDSKNFGTQTERTPKGKIFLTAEQVQPNDPFALAANTDTARVPYLHINCGTGDDFLTDAREFVQVLQKRKIKYSYLEMEGAHEVPYWTDALKITLPLVMTHLQTATK